MWDGDDERLWVKMPHMIPKTVSNFYKLIEPTCSRGLYQGALMTKAAISRFMPI